MAILAMPEHGQGCPWHVRLGRVQVHGRARPAKTLFPFSEGRRWTATGVLTSRRGPDEGSLRMLHFIARRKTFTLSAKTADKRCGRVPGGQRGGGSGTPGHALGHAVSRVAHTLIFMYVF